MASGPSRTLNSSTFVTLGDGLAAGAGDFGMSEELQPFSFPAQVARRLNTLFAQPVMEAPGIGPVIGFADLPVRLPQAMQTTVLKEFPPAAPFANLSIPGLKLADALTRRPTSPLIHRSDGLQTAINLVLGLPALVMPGQMPPPTQLEYAMFRQPTLALIALGYFDVLDAAFKADPAWIPDDVTFRVSYRTLLQPFGGLPTTVIAATIPDPADTAYFTPILNAPRVLKADVPVLAMMFGLSESDCLTPTGLIEAGNRLLTRTPGPLPEGCVVPASVVARLSERVTALNAQIRSVAEEHDALVFDLHGVFRRVKRDGVAVGEKILTADYFGGFYSLNGVYPGATGHAVIAASLLQLLDETFGTSYGPLDLADLAVFDPVVDYRLADGPAVTLADLASMPPPAAPPRPAPPAAPAAAGRAKAAAAPATDGRLQLPPGLQQVVPLDSRTSFYGDALRAAHTREERDIPYGSTPNTLFGGLCLVESHLQGSVRITFTKPEGDVTHFEVALEGGLKGTDGVLVAPQFFKLPCLMNQVSEMPGAVSSGDLNLATGEVSNLSFNVGFMNSALFALVSVNPALPRAPISFPGQYGSSWATFEQREDGLLDFSFRGMTFLPFGPGFGGQPTRFPLPFAGPAMHFASIPAVGTALHPHLSLSTKAPEAAPCGDRVPDIPTNTVREYTAFTHNTAFGDKFSLNIPELGGSGTGRSHLLGRVLIQFGEPNHGTVPVAVSTLVPGGMFAKPPDSPMAAMFPGRLSLGLLGHDETLHFPQTAYQINKVCFVDDPFEMSIGSVDLTTGRLLGPLLFRGFIVQDMLMALMQIEPRTPTSSFFFRGPAAFERDADGQTIFNFNGKVRVPYPEGFGFPQPDLRSRYTVGPDSNLDPFVYIQAMEGQAPPPAGKSGAAQHVVASNGQRFSYSYSIPGSPAGKPATFEYNNETTGGAFKMMSLVWVSFFNAKRTAAGRTEADVVSFTGIGVWNQDAPTPHMATVQISTATAMPYVSILIDGGMVSNVNTKPEKAVLPLPDYELF
ncbi:MAG: hypothetical protein WEB50_04655 [Vicinamibacterales bacterium]